MKYNKPNFFYEKQDNIYSCDSRFTYTLSANKTGKTLSHCLWINEQCILGPLGSEYAWLSPYIKTSEIAFNLLKKMITNSNLYKRLDKEKSVNQFHFNIVGLILREKSAS